MATKRNDGLVLTGEKLASMSLDDLQAVVDKLHYYEDKCHRLQTVNRSYVKQIKAYNRFVEDMKKMYPPIQ